MQHPGRLRRRRRPRRTATGPATRAPARSRSTASPYRVTVRGQVHRRHRPHGHPRRRRHAHGGRSRRDHPEGRRPGRRSGPDQRILLATGPMSVDLAGRGGPEWWRTSPARTRGRATAPGSVRGARGRRHARSRTDEGASPGASSRVRAGGAGTRCAPGATWRLNGPGLGRGRHHHPHRPASASGTARRRRTWPSTVPGGHDHDHAPRRLGGLLRAWRRAVTLSGTAFRMKAAGPTDVAGTFTPTAGTLARSFVRGSGHLRRRRGDRRAARPPRRRAGAPAAGAPAAAAEVSLAPAPASPRWAATGPGRAGPRPRWTAATRRHYHRAPMGTPGRPPAGPDRRGRAQHRLVRADVPGGGRLPASRSPSAATRACQLAEARAAPPRDPRPDAARAWTATRSPSACAATGHTPIIMLTARDDAVDKVVGPRARRRRLHHQAVQPPRAGGAGARGAAPRRGRAARAAGQPEADHASRPAPCASRSAAARCSSSGEGVPADARRSSTCWSR